MKKSFFLLSVLILSSCVSVKSHNNKLNNLIAVEDLKSDVDLAYQKLKDLHPKLYWYISQEKLTYKFDSLKSTITKPLTSFEFYKKLAPVIGEVREGHVFLYPMTKKMTKKETKALIKKGVGPISQFEFELFDNKMYVVKNKSYDKSIKVGSEVVEINGKKTDEYLKDYNPLLASDGYNTTFKTNKLPKNFGRFFAYENGVIDSVKYAFKQNDSIKRVTIFRKIVDTVGTEKQKKKILTDLQKRVNKEKAKALKIKKNVEGFDKETKEYRRNLKFIEKDSSVAIIKIRGFSIGSYKKFYKQSFKKIQDYKSKTLIIDLRNNGGGRLSEINNLYRYLSEKEFHFVDDAQLASKTSLMKMDYLKGSWYWLPFKIVAAPISYSIMYLVSSKKEDGNYYIKSSKKPDEVEETAFKGKIYVLINGGSFSAASIISSNLNGSKRAYFVGEETGGAFNGTVAGMMPLEKIKNSNLKLRLGLISCIPFHKTEKEGRGIFPDKEIIPTLQDRIDGKDPEMDWVLSEIRK